MTVVGRDELRFRDLPGRRTADPFAVAGRGSSTVRLVAIDPVPKRSPHVHPRSEEIVYVVSGHGRVWIDGAFHPVGPGSWCRIPPGMPHATFAEAGERMTLVCFFPHDDYADNLQELDLVVDGLTGAADG